jgi:hypothetical protein
MSTKNIKQNKNHSLLVLLSTDKSSKKISLSAKSLKERILSSELNTEFSLILFNDKEEQIKFSKFLLISLRELNPSSSPEDP